MTSTERTPDATGLSEPLAERLAELFQVLGSPTRLQIIARLAGGERCVHEIVEALEVSQSAVSHQLRLLHRGRLVARRREGRHIYYRLDDDHVRDLFERGLAHVAHEAAKEHSP